MSANLNDAAMAGNVEEVLMRLNMGEDVNQKCYPRYSTPLHDATCCGRTEVVKILLERGANVNELDYKNSTPLKLATRYGQDDIAALLEGAGALSNVEPPKKTSVVGVEPPWVRKSSRVSRREEIAGDGILHESSHSQNILSQQQRHKVNIEISDPSGVMQLEIDEKTKEAIEIEENKIKAIQRMENIVEVESIKDNSPRPKLDSDDEEVRSLFEKGNVETPWLVRGPQMKHLQREVSEAKDSEIHGANLFLRNSPETSVGNLLENVANVNRYSIHVCNIQKYLTPEIKVQESKNELSRASSIDSKSGETTNVPIMLKPREILKNIILEKSPSEQSIQITPKLNEMIMSTLSLEKTPSNQSISMIPKPNKIVTPTSIIGKSTERQVATSISIPTKSLTPTKNLENVSEIVDHFKETPTDKKSTEKNTYAENIIDSKLLEKQKVKNKFSNYQMKLAEKAKASEAIKDTSKYTQPDNQKLKTNQQEKKIDVVKVKPSTNQKITESKSKSANAATTGKIQVKSKPLLESKVIEKKDVVKVKPSTNQKTTETKTKEKTKVITAATIEKIQLRAQQMMEAAEKKSPNSKQVNSTTLISKQEEKEAATSKEIKTQLKPIIHADTNFPNTKQQITVTKIQTYLRPKPGDEALENGEEKTRFENLTNIKKVEVTGQSKPSVEARYIKLSAEREEEETSILETLESRRLREELMPAGLGVAARNAAEMAMQFEGKQPMQMMQTGVEEIMEEIIQEKQNNNGDNSSVGERIVTPTDNKVGITKQGLKEKCKTVGISKGTEEKNEDEEKVDTNLSDQGIEKTKQVLRESWQKVKKKRTKIEEGKQTISKQLDDKLGLTQKWSKIYKQKINKPSIEEEEEIVQNNSNEIEKLTEDQIKEQQAIIRKILEECVMLEQKKQQQNIEQNPGDLSNDIEQADATPTEHEDMVDDTILINKKLTLSEKVEEHLKLKQKWENVRKLKENIKEKVSKKGDEKQLSDSFHIKTKNVIKQKLEKLSCVASTEIEEPEEIEEAAETVEEPAMTGWFNKEESHEKEESVKEDNEVEIKVAQFGWFNKVTSLETESSLSMVGSHDTKLFNEVSMEQNEALAEENNEIDSNDQQFGWYSSALDSGPAENKQEPTKEAQKGLKQKLGKCKSMVSSVMRPMK